MPTDLDVLATLSPKQLRERAKNNPTGRHLRFEGVLIGAPDGYPFDPNCPYTYCRLCGAVYQTDLERIKPKLPEQEVESALNRKRWSFEHARTHPLRAHQELAVSGRYVSVEASQKLIPLGIIPLTDMAISDEHRQAAAEAPRLNNDPTGGY